MWSQGPWQARVGLDAHAAQKRVPQGAPEVAGYTLWHAAVTWRGEVSGNEVLAFAKLDNASNQLAYSATSILTTTAPGRQPLAGRSLRVGAQVAW
jgi:iron complex outermembrane recepter protein